MLYMSVLLPGHQQGENHLSVHFRKSPEDDKGQQANLPFQDPCHCPFPAGSNLEMLSCSFPQKWKVAIDRKCNGSPLHSLSADLAALPLRLFYFIFIFKVL